MPEAVGEAQDAVLMRFESSQGLGESERGLGFEAHTSRPLETSQSTTLLS